MNACTSRSLRSRHWLPYRQLCARRSLEARGRFWEGVQERVLEWRRPPRAPTLLDGVRKVAAGNPLSRLVQARPSVPPPARAGLLEPTLPDARIGSLQIAYRSQLRAALGVE